MTIWLLPLLLSSPADPPQDAGHGHSDGRHHHGADHARATHRFDDVDRWAAVWDDPERDEWQQPKRVIELMDIAPGMVVVDIGAGTGYFNPHLAASVGDDGAVYPVDIESTLVDYMVERARRENTPNVHPTLGDADGPCVPSERVDRVLLVNTYHHIGARRAYFARVRDQLAPGGLLINVDWKPGELDKGPGPEHKMHPDEVTAELVDAGFECRSTDALTYQYVQVFGVPAP